MIGNNILKSFHKHLVTRFLDLIILNRAKNTEIAGYDTIIYIHKRFHILISSGSIYTTIYSLERKGLLSGKWKENKRVYELTEKGKHTIDAIMNSRDLDLRTLLLQHAKRTRQD